MPLAKLTLNFGNRKFYDENGAALTTMNGKTMSKRKYELAIISSDELPMDLPDGTTVSVGIRDPAAAPGTMLSTTTAILAGWGTGSRWYFTLDLSGTAVFTFIGASASKNANFEVLIIMSDGQHLPSLTLPITLEKNVIEAVA